MTNDVDMDDLLM